MYKIIICDDELILRSGLKKLIEHAELPLEVSALAANGVEALELIRQLKPSIALMDINMPGLSGLDVIEAARDISPQTHFIIISGYDDFQYAKRACRLHVADYLLKPINKEEFLLLLKEVISHIQEAQLTTRLIVDAATADTTAKKILLYIQEHFTDPELTLAMVSDHFHLSQSYVTRIIKQEKGNSFSELLTMLRLDKAVSMLADPQDYKLVVIAEACGYSSQHYFCRVFKNSTGYTPMEYKKQLR
ncbi:MAG: response regulator [Lachnospiraceae bacterium]|nr:response regulator [Lachnospiraceae bacterium]